MQWSRRPVVLAEIDEVDPGHRLASDAEQSDANSLLDHLTTRPGRDAAPPTRAVREDLRIHQIGRLAQPHRPQLLGHRAGLRPAFEGVELAPASTDAWLPAESGAGLRPEWPGRWANGRRTAVALRARSRPRTSEAQGHDARCTPLRPAAT